jgi:hypothetical protein
MGDYTSLIGLAVFVAIASGLGIFFALKERREHSAHR